MWCSSRSSTERVASANDRYVAEVAAAAALIALTSIDTIVARRARGVNADIRREYGRRACASPRSSHPATTEPRAGEVRGDEIVAFATGTVLDRLASGDRTPADGPEYALADVTLLAPVPRPRAIFGIGLNYAAHAAETGQRAARAADGVHEAADLERARRRPGRRARRVVERARLRGRARASSSAPGGAIAGWAVADDVSARDLQRAEPQWTRAKGFDTSCPWGPWITTVDELPDAGGLRIRLTSTASCARTRTTADLIFGPQAARRLHRRDDHARARRDHPHRHARRASAWAIDPPRFLAAATSCASRSSAWGRSSTRSRLSACG